LKGCSLYYNLLLFSVDNLNKQIRLGIPPSHVKRNLSKHFEMLIKTSKYIVFPASVCYIIIGALLQENTLNATVWGVLIFVYTSFLPDILYVFRERKKNTKTTCLSWYKKYALLLFAPIFIWLLISDFGVIWKTTETFHNFKSLLIFEAFLAMLGFVSFGSLIEPLFFSLYGAVGYLSHLKVDKIW
jgi:hypothetical protein